MGTAAWTVVRTPLLLIALLSTAVACTPSASTAAPGAGTPPIATASPTATRPAGSGGTATPSPAASASPTPATNATPVVGGCPVNQTVCDFAAQISQSLAAGDFDAVVQRSVATPWDCPGPTPRGAGDAFPLCEGSTAGERRMGYLHARLQSEGTVMSAEQYRDFLRSRVGLSDAGASDAYGSGSFRLVSIGCPRPDTVSCAQQFVVAFSSIQPRNQPSAADVRTLLMFFVEQPSGAAPRINMAVDGSLFSGDPHEAVVTGGEAPTFTPQDMGPFGVFHRWTPAP